jgi:hypothetical protein
MDSYFTFCNYIPRNVSVIQFNNCIAPRRLFILFWRKRDIILVENNVEKNETTQLNKYTAIFKNNIK